MQRAYFLYMPAIQHLQSAFSRFRQLISDCRIGSRQPIDQPVEVCWRDSSGKITEGRAHCVDISEQGARIAYSQPVTLPAVMQIRSETYGVVKTGRVRHCTPSGSQYEIGLEFCSAEDLRGALKTRSVA